MQSEYAEKELFSIVNIFLASSKVAAVYVPSGLYAPEIEMLFAVKFLKDTA